ncbi:MAG: hypothetical protein II319_03455 [Clostridia bacterium]|nr:hypothetical protein [Clostridia bacterium]
MKYCNFPGFDKLEEGSPLYLALPLCEILHSFLGDRDFSYISAAMYPIELVELILHYLKYDKKIDRAKIKDFEKKYLTEDSLCPIEKLLAAEDSDIFFQMLADLKKLSQI